MSDYRHIDESIKAILLEKYLDGTASSVERRQVEEWSVYDDFIFEAIEGGFGIHSDVHRANIEGIKKNIQINKNISPAKWFSLAAVILILIGVWFTFKSIEDLNPIELNVVAENKKNISKDTVTLHNTGLVQSEPVIENNLVNGNETKDVEEKVVQKIIIDPIKINKEELLEQEVEVETQFLNDSEEPIQIESDAKGIINKNSNSVVLDEVIVDKNVDVNSRSDKFEDAINAQKQEAVPAVLPSRVMRRTGGQDGAMDFVEDDEIILDTTSVPVIGLDAYAEYIKDNKYGLSFSGYVRGDVIVQFTVSPNGHLSQFRIIQSLGKVMDDEAIRLIKNGCEWTNSNENIDIVTSYNVPFY